MSTRRIAPSLRQGVADFREERPRCIAKVMVIGDHARRWRKAEFGDSPDWDRCSRPSTVVIDNKPLCGRHGGELALAKLLGEKEPF